ncbi:MAG: hypothetical protein ABSG65_24575 [Bryobacteraceae bacterium]
MKSFLLEVPIIGERFGQAFPPHRLHGNAIGQAVTFVGPLAVKIEAGQKRRRICGITRITGLARMHCTLVAA